jgi:hypothetical protein
MARFADDANKLAKRSNNGIVQDVAAFVRQYIRGYVSSLLHIRQQTIIW